MGYFIAVGVAVLIWVVGMFMMSADQDARPFRSAATLAVVAVIGIMTAVSSYTTVSAGYIGIVYAFDAIVGQRTEGLQWVAPWQSVKQASIQVQGHKFTKHMDGSNFVSDDTLNCFSSETQNVYVQATLNIHVSPNHIQRLYREVGPDYFNILVAPRVLQAHKDEIVKYSSVEIAPHREDIRKAVRARLQKELSADSIDVRDLLIDNISFDPKFQAAIEEKQTQSQLALAEGEKVKGEKAKADQALEKARGEAGSILINAEKQADANLVLAQKQAEANELLTKSMTSQLIQYRMVEKLAPNVSVMMVPAGQPLLMQPPLLGK